MSVIAPWERSSFQPGGAANVFQLFVFSSGKLRDDVAMSASRFGLPSSEAMNFVDVRELPRSVDAAWFDGFRSGSLRVLAGQALGGDLSALDTATQLTAVLISREDAKDLTHLQAGWATAQWLIARGAQVVLDAQTNRFWKGEDVASWPAGRPFTLTTDVNIVVEAEPTSPTATIHTRGLQKFGRPDLVVRDVPGARWDAVAGLLRAIAGSLADGLMLKDGEVQTVDGQQVTFRTLGKDDLHLNNSALEVLPAST
ncbi:MAG: hypothetical protein ACO1OB_27965 [Archangium sp.]